MRIAIIGAGIAGLVAARRLHSRHDLVIFERDADVGGHSHTIEAIEGTRPIGLDTGFLVYNERNYPHFTRLLTELGVATQASEMSFSVQCRRCHVEYSGRSLLGLFARARQVVSPGFHRMLVDILRFNRWARSAADDRSLGALTLGEALARGPYSSELARHYLLPMTSAIWSGTPGDAARFPLLYFLRFCANHGLLELSGRPQWRTVSGGSRRYVEALVRPFADRIRCASPVHRVTRLRHGVEVVSSRGAERFDRVVLAVHADLALALLTDAAPDERRALAAIPFRQNRVALHTDGGLLPRRRVARASWNYLVQDCTVPDAPLRMSYYLNRLQRLDSRRDYLVTLNDEGAIARDRILATMTYEHPVYTTDGLAARDQVRALNGRRNTYYCGAWLGFGFHEDGVRSALDVAEALVHDREAA